MYASGRPNSEVVRSRSEQSKPLSQSGKIRGPMGDEEKLESLADNGYTAFEKWDYNPLVFVAERPKPWISFKESFYRGSEFIIKNLAQGRGFPEIEGVA